MSIVIYKEGIQSQPVGRKCPKCESGSVFYNRKYKFFGLIYDYSIDECEIKECGYKRQSDKRDYILNKILK